MIFLSKYPHLVKELLCYPEMSKVIFNSSGVVLQQGICVSERVAGLKNWCILKQGS